MKKFSLFSFLVLLISLSSSAITGTSLQTVDSLLSDYHQTSGHNKYALGQRIIDLCIDGDKLTDHSLHINNNQPTDSADLLVYFAAERFYYNHTYFAECLEYIGKAMPLSENHDENIHATLLCDYCYCLYKQGKLTEAAQAGQNAMEFCLHHNQPLQLARAYLYLAIVNYSIPQIDQAKLFVEKAIAIDKEIGMNNNTHNILGIACEIYSFAGEAERAIDYGNKALEAARTIGYDEGVVNHLSQLSYAYNRQGDYQRGLATARQAVEAVEQMEIPDRNLLAISLEYVAYNLLDMKRGDEAIPVLLRAIDLEREVGNVRSVCYDYKALAEAYEPSNPRQAVAALRKYIAMADSIHNAALNEALSKANAEFRNDELLEKSAEHQRQNRLILIAGTTLTMLLITVISLIIYAYRLRGKKNQNLRQQQQMRDTFFTNVTHEFRTPLTVILGLSRQLQLDGEHNEDQTVRSAQLIEYEGNRLIQLVNQLLDAAKMEMGGGTPQWQRGNIVPLLSMLTDSLQQIARDRGINLSYEVVDKEQETDHVVDYIQKIVTNLLSNALKNTPNGGKVLLKSRIERSNMVLTVSDTGTGIDAEDLPHIFKPFFQGRHTIAGHGTGIGLTLTKQMVVAMHGTIDVKSNPGEGTIFTIRLPLRQKGADVAKIIGKTPEELLPPPQYPLMALSLEPFERKDRGTKLLVDSPIVDDDNRKRMLIVEDNREVAYYIGSLLISYYDVFYAENGEQALEKARQLVPDIIITDIMMPCMDGLQLCRHIRHEQLTCHIPIIVVTAKVSEESRLKGLEAGATAYLNKPFNSDELILLVKNLLLQQQLLQQQFADRNEVHQAQKNTPDNEVLSSVAASLDQRFLDKLHNIVLESMKDQHTDIEYLAPLMAMSQTQLRRKISAITGCSPAKYIMQLRIEEAKNLLRQYPAITIIEVAFSTGFADNAHFTKVFHRYTDMTPMQYIKLIQQVK